MASLRDVPIGTPSDNGMASQRNQTEIKAAIIESTPTVASQLVKANSTSDSNNQSEMPWIKILILMVSGLFLTTIICIAVVLNNNNTLKVKEAKLQEITQRRSTNIRRAISPRDFIEKHYSDLNNRNYYSTWNYLTAQFQNKSKSFDDYKDWWDSVERTEIGQIQVLKQTSSTALLDVQLTYVMKTGKVYQDPRSRIYLVWDEYANSWVFKDKQYKYFSNYQFPTASCGDRDPGGANTWYPVFIKDTEHNFNQVRDRFCRDAIRKYREDRQSTSIQVASFTNKAKAEEFALILKINLGTGEVGQPKVRNFD